MIEAIIVLGMHRSGTSCLAGFLKSQGVNFGEVSTYNRYNKKGNQEDKEIFRFNEAVLKFNQGSWDSPPKRNLILNQELNTRLQELVSKYEKTEIPWAFKDPRMLMVYEVWERVLPKHVNVGTFRHPLAVAESLYARDAFPVPIEKGLELWEIYNTKLIELYKQKEFQIINFDLSQNDYIVRLKQISASLGLIFNEKAVFFESGLRNQKTYSFEQCPDNLKPIYQNLLEIN